MQTESWGLVYLILRRLFNLQAVGMPLFTMRALCSIGQAFHSTGEDEAPEFLKARAFPSLLCSYWILLAQKFKKCLPGRKGWGWPWFGGALALPIAKAWQTLLFSSHRYPRDHCSLHLSHPTIQAAWKQICWTALGRSWQLAVLKSCSQTTHKPKSISQHPSTWLLKPCRQILWWCTVLGRRPSTAVKRCQTGIPTLKVVLWAVSKVFCIRNIQKQCLCDAVRNFGILLCFRSGLQEMVSSLHWLKKRNP